jgi:histidine phosphotransferase ChpT
MITELRLAELLCAQLCHDMSSPIGVILGALPLLRQGGLNAEEAGEIADRAAREAAGRLKLLRAAWSGEQAARTGAEIATLLYEGTRRMIRVELPTLARCRFPADAGRLALNLGLLAGQRRSRPVTLRLSRDGSALLARLRGRGVFWPDSPTPGQLARSLLATAAREDPRLSQLPVTLLLARRAGMQLQRDRANHALMRVAGAFPDRQPGG